MIPTPPPHDPNDELCVIGSLLTNTALVDQVAGALRPDDFYDVDLAQVYSRICEMAQTGSISLPKLNSEFGSSMLLNAGQAVVNSAHVDYYVNRVRDNAIRRGLILSAMEVVQDARDMDKDASLVAESAESLFRKAVDEASNKSDVQTVEELVPDWADSLAKRIDGQIPVGLQTGFFDVDDIIGGLRPQELIVAAGRPGMGKTAWALCNVHYLTVKCQKRVLFISLEMSSDELLNRLVSLDSGVDGRNIQSGNLSRDEAQLVWRSAKDLRSSGLMIDSSEPQTIQSIGSKARMLSRRHGLDLVVIDYLSLVQAEDTRQPRHVQVGSIANGAKRLARQINAPVIVLAQLNRDSEKDKKPSRPRLSQLRESGDVEQAADVVLFIHREGYHQQQSTEETAKIIIAKNRNGRVGDAELRWTPSRTEFGNMLQPVDFGTDDDVGVEFHSQI